MRSEWLGCARTFLGAREQTTVLLEREIDIDEISACQQLHNHARGDDGAYSKFHESAPIGGKDDTHPIEWVRRIGGHDAVEGDL